MNTSEALIQVKNLTYRPIGADHDVLKDINLDIHKEDFILLLGPSGCGKTSLIRCFNGLIPHLDEGSMQGSVLVDGKETSTHQIHEFASTIGMVFQNPDDQIVSLRVIDEVAWGVENQGLSHEEIVQRVSQFMELLGITELKDRLTFAISGGQKQKVSIASNLAMLQEVLVLDDPTTDLDPVCKAEVVQTLAHLHQDLEKTLVVIEHDLNDLIELATRIVIMQDGSILYDGLPKEVFFEHYDAMAGLGVNVPQHVEIAHAVITEEGTPHLPILKDEAFQLLEDFISRNPAIPSQAPPPIEKNGHPVLNVKNLKYAYNADRPVLRDLTFDIHQGEFLAIVGANGSGKSTLINNLTGLLKPNSGEVWVSGHNTAKVNIADLAKDIGYVFQDPDQQLFASTVWDEVAFSLHVRKTPEEEVERRVKETLESVGLDHLSERHPFSLSRGQRQKLAVATALVHQPSVILLDEPTTGQDRKSLAGLLGMMNRLNQQGNTTIIITHDMDIVAAYATRMIVMADGEIVLDGRPAEIFYDRYETLNQLNLRPPTVIEFCRRLQDRGVPRCLTVEELISYIKEVSKQKT
jgi:energy-coupling factor transporter ATP-binding protein EcfA2